MSDILQAARSYYGLADANVRKTEWFTDEGKPIICFEIVAEGEDFIGIVERMKRLQEEKAIKPDLSDVPSPIPNSEELRKAYNALSVRERSKYSSFTHFAKLADTVTATDTEMTFHNGPRRQQANQILQQTVPTMPDEHKIEVWPSPAGLHINNVYGSTDIKRQVAHIDAPETEEPTTMDAVWLWEHETSDAQRQFASDRSQGPGEEACYLVQWAMLTEEQRQKAKEKL